MTAAVISHSGPNLFRNGIKILDEILHAFLLQLIMAIQRGIEFVDIGLVMFGVVT